MGTAQLRMVPEAQALATLRRGFQLGINWVHTAPDYGGAEVLVARAIAETGRDDIRVFSSSAGTVEHFGWTFENTCRLLGRKRLEIFGISGIDYCEESGLDVWGPRGLLAFLEEMRRAGRLKHIFCSTHGAPEYVGRLIASKRFDAIMLSYNPLGFHVLSYHGAAEGKAFEDLKRNRGEIFPLARKQRIGLLVIKPLAGGLLCPSRAFPAHRRFSEETEPLRAAEVLRAILHHPEVSAVAPGMACVEEVEENALAGCGPVDPSLEEQRRLDRTVAELQRSLCSRCGECESTCSRSLPVSWLFREGYIWNYPADTFEALGRLHYFKLHPDEEPACARCDRRTCRCPSGIDIPAGLIRVHEQMRRLRRQGLMHATPEELEGRTVEGPVRVRVVCRELALPLEGGAPNRCRLWVENAGEDNWLSFFTQPHLAVSLGLAVSADGAQRQLLPLLHDVGPGQRTHFAYDFQVPQGHESCRVRAELQICRRNGVTGESTLLFDEHVRVE